MRGPAHTLAGAALWLATAPALPITPTQLALGTIAAAGAGLLPDADHPHAVVARTYGWPTRLFALAVARVSGGHRNGTHSIFGVAVFGAVTAVPQLHDLAPPAAIAAISAALFAAATVIVGHARRGLRPGRILLAAALGVAYGLAAALAAPAVTAVILALLLGPAARALNLGRIHPLAATIAPIGVAFAIAYHGDTHVLPAAVAIGALSHILTDCCTRSGCPLLWPYLETTYGLRFMRTGGRAEPFATALLAIAAVALAIPHAEVVAAALTTAL